MEAAHLQRLEETLEDTLRMLPEDATQVEVDVPRSVAPTGPPGWEDAVLHGREVQLYYPHEHDDDLLVLEWRSGDGAGSQRISGHISQDPTLGKVGRRVYDLARRARATWDEAHQSAVAADQLDEGAAELCLRLLADGTRSGRAVELAALAAA